MGVNWRRAKHWMSSPDPNYARKKRQRDRLICRAETRAEWVVGFQDEVWWSRFAQPSVSNWTDGEPLRVQILEPSKDDPDPKALCCYGLYRTDTGRMMLRFVEGRAVSYTTVAFLEWVCQRLSEEGKKALLLIWDDASWHASHIVRDWIRDHNRQAKREGTARILACYLPAKSPWLNNIEPHWVHGKRAIFEPDRKLTADEVTQRVCEYFGCEVLKMISRD
jgi:hypothetical protein